MGIYDPNGTMPTNCAACPYVACVPKDADTFAALDFLIARRKAKKMPKDCPLVEVKTPHGRLLDENDVKNTFKFSEDAEYARWTLAGVFMDIEDTEAVLESEE